MRKSDLPTVVGLVAELDGCRLLLRAIETRGCDVRFADVRLGSDVRGCWSGDGAPDRLTIRGRELLPALKAMEARLEGEIRGLGVLL